MPCRPKPTYRLAVSSVNVTAEAWEQARWEWVSNESHILSKALTCSSETVADHATRRDSNHERTNLLVSKLMIEVKYIAAIKGRIWISIG